MTESQEQNLSITLFKSQKQAKETSTLVHYMSNPPSVGGQSDCSDEDKNSWYRILRRMQWVWQGVDPIEMEEILANMAHSPHPRSSAQLLDTVIGYRPGNWAYEWTSAGMRHQKRSKDLEGDEAAHSLYMASLYYSIAGYPHLKGDSLSVQAQVLANKAYQEANEHSSYTVKTIEVPYKGKSIKAFLHLPQTDKPLPVVMVSAGLDTLQSDMWRFFQDYLVPENFAMLTLDMPSLGHSLHWPLTEDSSCLHQAVLDELPNVPWVDHHKVSLLGFRLGGHAAVRLSFLEPNKIKACVALGAPIHSILADSSRLAAMPKMYLDTIASRVGKQTVDVRSMTAQMQAWSLKMQGFLVGRRTSVPILALGVEGDPISSTSDNNLVAMYSQSGKAMTIPSKPLYDGYHKSLVSAIKWIKNELG